MKHKRITPLIAILSLSLMVNCTNNRGKKENYDETHDYSVSYYNDKYDYSIAYPSDFLSGQGESDAHDGQVFVSEDETVELRVYARYNVFDQSIDDIANEVKQEKRHIIRQEKEENRFFVESETQGGNGELQYVRYRKATDAFYFLTLSYPNSRSEHMKRVFNRVRDSFDSSINNSIAAENSTSDVEPFSVFITRFFQDCYYAKNFNQLLRDNDPALRRYISKEADVRRYYNPGAFPYLFDRMSGFGFHEYNDFETPAPNEQLTVYNEFPEWGGEEPGHYETADGIYYHVVDKAPVYVESTTESMEQKEVQFPFQNQPPLIEVLVIRDQQQEKVFYFAELSGEYKLVLVDDVVPGSA